MLHKNPVISDEVFTDDLAWRLLRHFAALKLLIDPNGHKKTPSFLTRFLLMIWRGAFCAISLRSSYLSIQMGIKKPRHF
jgi:hypothetical protein